MENNKLEDYLKQITETFGPTNRCFGENYRLSFVKDDLITFLKELKDKDDQFKLFNQSVAFFKIHMEALNYLIEKDTHKTNDPIEILYPHVWSKLAFSIIFSVIDGITKSSYIPISKFLRDNFTSIKSKDDLTKLCEEYHEKYATVSRLSSFYDNYLNKIDKERIIKDYMPEDGKAFYTIKDVIKDMYGRIRSGFLHNMGMTVPYHQDIIFSLKDEDYIEMFANLSPSQFLFLSWKAIFNFFDYNKEIDSKFTK